MIIFSVETGEKSKSCNWKLPLETSFIPIHALHNYMKRHYQSSKDYHIDKFVTFSQNHDFCLPVCQILNILFVIFWRLTFLDMIRIFIVSLNEYKYNFSYQNFKLCKILHSKHFKPMSTKKRKPHHCYVSGFSGSTKVILLKQYAHLTLNIFRLRHRNMDRLESSIRKGTRGKNKTNNNSTIRGRKAMPSYKRNKRHR